MPGPHRRGVRYAKAIYFWRPPPPIPEIASQKTHPGMRYLLSSSAPRKQAESVESYTRHHCYPLVASLSLERGAPELSRSPTTHQGAAPYFFTFHTSHSLWEVRKHGTVARWQARSPRSQAKNYIFSPFSSPFLVATGCMDEAADDSRRVLATTSLPRGRTAVT